MGLAKLGVWTPTAMVVCVACHGVKFPRKTYDTESVDWAEVNTPAELKDGRGITKCDKCNEDIQIYSNIAVEHNLVLELRELGIDAEMEQTGGMNSAVGLYEDKEGSEDHWYVTFDMDGDNQYVISGLFNEAMDWDMDGESFATEDKQKAIEYILSLKGVRKIND